VKRKAKKKAAPRSAAIVRRAAPAQAVDALSLGKIDALIAAYEKRGDIWGLLDLHAKGKGAEVALGEIAKRSKGEHDDGLRAQGRAMAAVLRIERGLGGLCGRIRSNTPKKKRARGAGQAPLPTLADVGITKKESSRWQKLAGMTDEQFSDRVRVALEKCGRASISAAGQPASESSKYSPDEHYTPRDYIDLVREVLGSIDLDPASNLKAQTTVGAARWYGTTEDGLSDEHPWKGRVFLNPPYSNPAPFVMKLLDALGTGDVPEAIVLTNNTTDTEWAQSLLEASAAVCFTRGRIAFDRPDSKANKGTRQGQIFFYLGNDPGSFISSFEEFSFDADKDPIKNAILRPASPLHVPEQAEAEEDEHAPDARAEEVVDEGEWFEDEQPAATA